MGTVINDDAQPASQNAQQPFTEFQDWRQFFGGRGCHRGGWRGRGNWKHMANHFINMAQQYVADAGSDDEQEEEKKDGGCSGGWRQACGNRSRWGEKRAIFNIKPENKTVEGDPGKFVFYEVEVTNNTKWPWKKGCYLGMVDKNSKSALKVKDIPIDFEVKGLQTFKLSIPIFIPEDIDVTNQSTFEVSTTFYGPKNTPFGQTLNINVKVNEGNDQVSFYKTVITLTEAGLGNFDECTAALTQCNGDENAAVQMLIERKKQEASSTNVTP